MCLTRLVKSVPTMRVLRFVFWGVALIAAGCKQEPPAQKTAAEPAKPPEYFHVDAATAATVHGKISYHGPKPARERINMDAEAACEQAHAGHPAYEEPI